MDERELSDLLRSAERPRRLTVEERHRALARLGLEEPAKTLDAGQIIDLEPQSPRLEDDLLQLEFAPIEPKAHRFRRKALALVASAIIVVGLAGIVAFPRDDFVDMADPGDTNVLPEGAFEAPCTGALTELTEAIDQWGGISNWAFAGNAEPDLALLLNSALDAFAEIGVIRLDIDSLAATLNSRLEMVDDGELPLVFEEADGRETALRTAVAGLLATLHEQPTPASCDLESLDLAMEEASQQE